MGGAMVQRTVKFRQRGATGNGIKSVSRTYAISAQGTTVNDTAAPAIYGTWSSSSPAVTEAYPYLWAKEIVVYTDDSSTTRYYCVGGRGANGVDAQDIEWVYVRTTENVQPVIVAESGNGYLSDDYKPLAKVTSGRIKGGSEGNANVNVRCTDDPQGVDSTWKYEWEIKREKGTADANGHRAWVAYSGSMTLHNRYVKDITSANVYYALEDSGSTAPEDSSFTLDKFPTTLNAGKYVWEATKVTYSDGTSEFTAKMCLGPTTDFLSGTEVYAISTSNSTAPADSQFGTTYNKTKGYYLWTATRVQYTNETYGYLNKKCVGYWGTDGDNAPYEIVSYRRYDSRNANSSGEPSGSSDMSDWSNTAPPATSSYPYIWQRIQSYDKGGNLLRTSYVCMTGEKGESITGKTGRFHWYAGLMSEVGGDDFTADDYQSPYVNIGTDDDPVCYVYVGDNVTTTFPTSASGYTKANGWEDMTTDFKYIIAKAVFSGDAHLGSFVINKDWMISQYGTRNGSASEDYTYFDPLLGGDTEKVLHDKVNVTYNNTALSRFVLKSGVTYTFTITVSTSSTKSEIELYNSSGSLQRTVTFDNGTTTLTQTFTFTPSSAGEYYFMTEKWSSSTTVLATIKVACSSAFIPNFAVDGKTGKTYQNDAHIKGEVHATSGTFKGTMTTLDETVNTFTNQGSTTDYYAKRGVEVKYNKERQTVAELVSTEWDNGASGMLSLRTRRTSDDALRTTTTIYPGSINMYSGSTTDVSTEVVQLAYDSYGGFIFLKNKSLLGGADLRIRGTGEIIGNVGFPSSLKTSSFTLPDAPSDGMILFCKGTSSALTITTKSHPIMARNSNDNWCDANSSATIPDRDSVILIYDSSIGKWLYFSCD